MIRNDLRTDFNGSPGISVIIVAMNPDGGLTSSNARSTVAVLQSKTRVAIKPFEVQHTSEGFAALTGMLNALEGEARIVMEHTGRYYESFAMSMHQAGGVATRM